MSLKLMESGHPGDSILFSCVFQVHNELLRKLVRGVFEFSDDASEPTDFLVSLAHVGTNSLSFALNSLGKLLLLLIGLRRSERMLGLHWVPTSRTRGAVLPIFAKVLVDHLHLLLLVLLLPIYNILQVVLLAQKVRLGPIGHHREVVRVLAGSRLVPAEILQLVLEFVQIFCGLRV